MKNKKALIVTTNHTDFEHPKAEPTGLWLSELVHFYDEIEKDGFEIEIVSPKGGKVSILDCLPMEIETTTIHHHIESINPDIVCYVVYGQNPNSSSANMHGVIKYSVALNKNARKKYFEIIKIFLLYYLKLLLPNQ